VSTVDSSRGYSKDLSDCSAQDSACPFRPLNEVIARESLRRDILRLHLGLSSRGGRGGLETSQGELDDVYVTFALTGEREGPFC
jgi:hypothetical protein